MRATQPNTFLGRQPILDRTRRIVAYELLFRDKESLDEARITDGVVATAHVVNLAFRRIGIRTLVGHSRAFINVDAEYLLSHALEVLPQDRVVIEILETVDVDERILRRCRTLRRRGYRFALDDFLYRDDNDPLLDIVDFVKIDILQTDPRSLLGLVERLKLHRLTVLAEKVDNAERARECLHLGFDLFQGFLFGLPVVLRA